MSASRHSTLTADSEMSQRRSKHSKDPSLSCKERISPCIGSSKNTISFASHAEYPDDGICPSVSEFHEVLTASYDAWNSIAFASTEAQLDLFCIDPFLEFVEGIPTFTAPPLNGVPILQTEDDLRVECALEWETTEHPDCDRPEKLVKFSQLLANSYPAPYSICDNTRTNFLHPGLVSNRLSDLSYLV